MRFLMLNWRDPRNPLSGGAERVTRAYLAELVRRGHEVAWFTYAFPGGAREEVIDGIRIIRGGGKFTSIIHARRWYRAQPKFDLVIDQHHGLPWFAPWWCRTNCLAYIHEVLGPIWSAFYPWPISTVGRWQERWTHWLYRRVPFWTVSDSTANQLRAHGVQSVSVFPNGTDTEAVAELEPKPIAEPLRLVAVSRLAPNKQVDHVIRAVRALHDAGIDVGLDIVGTGEEEAKLKSLAGELQLQARVRFTGLLAEQAKNDVMRRAHFLVHTSQREGWGLNVIEANAVGTPAVVYPVGGLVDSTVHDVTGLVAELETPASVAACLQSVLHDPARYDRYRRAAWERAKTFHWSQVLQRTTDWLESLARGGQK